MATECSTSIGSPVDEESFYDALDRALANGKDLTIVELSPEHESNPFKENFAHALVGICELASRTTGVEQALSPQL